MLLVIESPDAKGDAAAGKRTLVVRLGGAMAARLHGRALLVAYAALPLLVVFGLPRAVTIAVATTASLVFWQDRRMRCAAWADPARWDSLGFWSVPLLMGTTVVELPALLA